MKVIPINIKQEILSIVKDIETIDDIKNICEFYNITPYKLQCMLAHAGRL